MKNDEKRMTMQLRLDEAFMKMLSNAAKSKGLNKTSLVKMWVLEKLKEEADYEDLRRA